MQDTFKINGVELLKQPSKWEPQWSTTHTADSGRPQGGDAHITPLFTVWSYAVEFEDLNAEEAAQILKAVVQTRSNPTYTMHYWDAYEGKWKDGVFYTGQGAPTVKTLRDNCEKYESISFNCVAVEALR